MPVIRNRDGLGSPRWSGGDEQRRWIYSRRANGLKSRMAGRPTSRCVARESSVYSVLSPTGSIRHVEWRRTRPLIGPVQASLIREDWLGFGGSVRDLPATWTSAVSIAQKNGFIPGSRHSIKMRLGRHSQCPNKPGGVDSTQLQSGPWRRPDAVVSGPN